MPSPLVRVKSPSLPTTGEGDLLTNGNLLQNYKFPLPKKPTCALFLEFFLCLLILKSLSFFFNSYWGMVDLQCCVSFFCMAK